MTQTAVKEQFRWWLNCGVTAADVHANQCKMDEALHESLAETKISGTSRSLADFHAERLENEISQMSAMLEALPDGMLLQMARSSGDSDVPTGSLSVAQMADLRKRMTRLFAKKMRCDAEDEPGAKSWAHEGAQSVLGMSADRYSKTRIVFKNMSVVTDFKTGWFGKLHSVLGDDAQWDEIDRYMSSHFRADLRDSLAPNLTVCSEFITRPEIDGFLDMNPLAAAVALLGGTRRKSPPVSRSRTRLRLVSPTSSPTLPRR